MILRLCELSLSPSFQHVATCSFACIPTFYETAGLGSPPPTSLPATQIQGCTWQRISGRFARLSSLGAVQASSRPATRLTRCGGFGRSLVSDTDRIGCGCVASVFFVGVWADNTGLHFVGRGSCVVVKMFEVHCMVIPEVIHASPRFVWKPIQLHSFSVWHGVPERMPCALHVLAEGLSLYGARAQGGPREMQSRRC